MLPSRKFRVGDSVSFLFGTTTLVGIVVEDRGAIGAGGRRLFRVEVPFGIGEDSMFLEIPEDELNAGIAALHPK
jgi:hypothetical protein